MNLRGITNRKRGSRGVVNPIPHTPIQLQNRVILEVVGPNGVRQRVVEEGNVMVSYGLNRLSEMLVSDAGGASDYVRYLAVGSSSQAPATNDAGLVSSINVSGRQTVTRSDAGNYTAEYRATLSDTDNAWTMREVGLFESTNQAASMIARRTYADVNKATNETVNATYQLIAKTAA